jgi:hypothetical protein
MKTVKIVFGFLIIFGVGKEYAHASRELLTFFSPGIIMGVLLSLLLSTWLIGSALSKEKLRVKSYQFLKYFLLCFLCFVLFAFFSLASYRPPNDMVEVNGIKIPIGNFLDGSRRIVPDSAQRRVYCICVVEKLASSDEIVRRYRPQLESGRIDKIFDASKNEPLLAGLGIEACIKSVELQWTDNLSDAMKGSLKTQLVNTDFEKTNDIDSYCDCLIEEYQKYPVSKITNDKFIESKLGAEIDSMCIAKSRK